MVATSQVSKYFEALERLKGRGAPINNDAVAIEAGSGRGSIKKSRLAYAELIAAIDMAATEQAEARATSDPVPGLRQDPLRQTRCRASFSRMIRNGATPNAKRSTFT